MISIWYIYNDNRNQWYTGYTDMEVKSAWNWSDVWGDAKEFHSKDEAIKFVDDNSDCVVFGWAQ